MEEQGQCNVIRVKEYIGSPYQMSAMAYDNRVIGEPIIISTAVEYTETNQMQNFSSTIADLP